MTWCGVRGLSAGPLMWAGIHVARRSALSLPTACCRQCPLTIHRRVYSLPCESVAPGGVSLCSIGRMDLMVIVSFPGVAGLGVGSCVRLLTWRVVVTLGSLSMAHAATTNFTS